MHRKTHSRKTGEKHRFIGKDQLDPQEKMASLKSPSEPINHNEAKPQAEIIHPQPIANPAALNTTTTNTTSTLPPITRCLDAEKTHQNPIEKRGITCKKMSDPIRNLLKHLF
jgi:hypothetical protein